MKCVRTMNTFGETRNKCQQSSKGRDEKGRKGGREENILSFKMSPEFIRNLLTQVVSRRV